MKHQVIVLGVTAPIGTDTVGFANRLKGFLTEKYNCGVHSIKLSELLKIQYQSELDTKEFLKKPWLEQLKRKIELGNNLRQKFKRPELFGEWALFKVYETYQAIMSSKIERHVIVVDQFKRPEEIRYLSQALGDAFWLIAVDSPQETRLDKLTKGDSSLKRIAEDLMKIDEKESGSVDSKLYGQKMREVYLNAHLIVRDDAAIEELTRFFDLLFGSHLVTPNKDEYFMNLAFAASLKTGDLSRQVGAVVVSEHGDQMSSGTNEVNGFGGGAYWGEGCNELSKRKDSNKERIQEIKQVIEKRIKENLTVDDDVLNLILSGTPVDDLTEFHRTTHAEMDAILSAQRNQMTTRNAIMYCTTFPCHNCAKHIVSAGIKRVVFLEPYPKSLAMRLHDDSISTTKEDNKVHFDEFHGITHVKFKDLFSLVYSTGTEIVRKDSNDHVPEFDRKTAKFRFSIWKEKLNGLGKIIEETFDSDGRIKVKEAA